MLGLMLVLCGRFSSDSGRHNERQMGNVRLFVVRSYNANTLFKSKCSCLTSDYDNRLDWRGTMLTSGSVAVVTGL